MSTHSASSSTAAPSPDEAVVAVPAEMPAEEGKAKRRGAGRNLPAAIAVGLALVGVLVLAVLVVPQAFPVVAAITMSLAMLELVRALSHAGLRLPAVPLLVGVVGMVVSTVVFGAEGLLIATAAAVCVLILWRVSESMGLSALRDVTGGVFALAWVPFLGCFLLLLMQRDQGAALVMLAVLGPVGNDIGGYIAGVLFGAHPMAPRISPKKSWEGFAGSLLLGTALVTAVSVLALNLPWTVGVAIGAVLVIVSTGGDLSQSLLKRDLGIKDMGHLLPGHGGVLDRVDSILLAAPTTYVMLEVLLS